MSRNKVLLGGGAVAIAVFAIGAWWLGFFSEAPEEVNITDLAEAVEEQAEPEPEPEQAEQEQAEPEQAEPEQAEPEQAEPEGATIESLDGTWNVTPIEDQTFVGYRINEVLSTIGDFEVVGRTAAVTGTLEGSGTSIAAVDIVADMSAITTDNPARDNAMRSQALETGDFPNATFTLVDPFDLGSIPAEGVSLSVTAVGDLTIHGVTQRVEFPLEAQIQSGSIVVTGQLLVQLSDYDIDAPSAPIVASVEDVATLELALVFSR